MSVVDRVLLGAGGAALLVAMLAGWLLLAPTEGADDPGGLSLILSSSLQPVESIALSPSVTPAAAEVVVDVEGGVMEPGLQRLAPGARIADAIAAAGGYAPSADLEAATRALNLAAQLTDGEQVYVPMIGDDARATDSQPVASSAAGAGGIGGGGGLIDLNTATPEELDTLPGIGPVTVQKIVAARQEQPFASLEEAVERGVLNRGQLDKIRDLATAG